ncbi:murein DD-endopeptidase MepM/ murein hydrolase activator NlpD [Streptomyces olivoverticillatus]|uniref:Murein DD-endopeptidase MepM/ murein hydrolase activator NlpD n=1 Tax=Streptomyces olivoverticillatus TaxID=66427 RepID=A0A7W7LK93_9ACTN|nr:M23 family metallopeptidase [Streptomyces olivoverticillatus]MBB4891789.1 murein DD-endopeptidase MepM/ murein hydrolase activator NlpD [Streptomyces olivoverticillatus]
MDVVVNDRHQPAGPGPAAVPAADAAYGHYPSYEQQGFPQTHTTGRDGYGHGYGSGWDTSATFTAFDASGAQTTSDWGNHPSGVWQGDTTGQWGGVTGHTQTWDFSTYGIGAHDTGQYDTGQHGTGQYSTEQYGADPHSGQWGTSGWGHTQGEAWGAATAGSYDTGHSGQWDTSVQYPGWDSSGQFDFNNQQTQTWDASAFAAEPQQQPQAEAQRTPTVMVDFSAAVPGPRSSVADAETQMMSVPEMPEAESPGSSGSPGREEPAAHHGSAGHGSRRKSAPARTGYRPRRKALLTVAIPSVAVMGVAGIAAASVGTGGQKDTPHTTAAAAPDTAVKLSAANSQLDTQLAGLSRGADDFATRASRTQERIDLKARQDEERKRKAEEAARKEAERPKFVLPVTQHGLSAYFGQAGVNWMSVHTGIDFPVSYGTPVMAATDGTVRTQYNVAYGNMAIVTAPDGTETWYCHLSSTKIRSGSVKAGDVIAYSGNSGNSTGPHLHFEVRPNGSAVDPLPWLRGHDLDPT